MIKGNVVQPQNVKWYQISGNIEDNEDLVNYISEATGDYKTDLASEISSRVSGDKEIKESLSTEVSTRTNQYQELYSDLTTEIVNRAAADSELNTSIKNEASQRALADTNLSNSIISKADKSEIPTNLSQLTNDLGFTTESWVESQNYLKTHQDISGKADITYVDTKVASINVPTKTSELTNDSGYITNSANNLTNYYLKEQTINTSDFIGHTNNSNIHVTQEEKSAWNAKADLSAIPTKTSQLTNDSGFLTEHQSLDGYATEEWVENKNYASQSWVENKNYASQSWVESKGYLTEQSISGKADITYVDSQIETVEGEIPTKTSELTNDSNFITKLVSDLENYYLKTETYTKSEVDSLVSSISKLKFKVVETLPTVGETNIIYLVPKTTTEEKNIYDEYIYVEDKWERIGNTNIVLSNYYTKTEIDNKGYATKESLKNHTNNTNIHVTYTEKQKWDEKSTFSGSYNDLTNKPTLFSGNYNDLTNKPTLFSGDYDDLTNKPTKLSQFIDNLGSSPTHTHSQYAKSSSLSTVATSGNYSDLLGKPEIPTKTSDLTNDSDFITSEYHDSTKQDVLTAGNNISITDNVVSATGVAKSSTGITILVLTQAEYDALTTKDSNTMYVING